MATNQYEKGACPLGGEPPVFTVEWLGHACYRLTSKEGDVIITDPYDNSMGISLPKGLTADLVTTSHQHFDHHYLDAIQGQYAHFNRPGDFKWNEIEIRGIETYHDEHQGRDRGHNLIYTFTLDQLTIAHLGDLGHVPSPDQLEKMGKVDVLLIPIGGYYTLEMEAVKETIQLIQPSIIIPMHYRYSTLNLPISDLQTFLDQYPHTPVHHYSGAFPISSASLNQYRGIVVLADSHNR